MHTALTQQAAGLEASSKFISTTSGSTPATVYGQRKLTERVFTPRMLTVRLRKHPSECAASVLGRRSKSQCGLDKSTSPFGQVCSCDLSLSRCITSPGHPKRPSTSQCQTRSLPLSAKCHGCHSTVPLPRSRARQSWVHDEGGAEPVHLGLDLVLPVQDLSSPHRDTKGSAGKSLGYISSRTVSVDTLYTQFASVDAARFAFRSNAP